MKIPRMRDIGLAATISFCAVCVSTADASEVGEIIAANYGSAGLPKITGRLVCPEASGRDGLPVHFETELAEPVVPSDFVVRGMDGAPRPVLCATFDPSDDVGDRRSILLVGEFGDESDQPITVEIVGDVRSIDGGVYYKGATADFIPLEAPPAIILAEIVPEDEWDLGSRGTRIPWGGGTGCPAKGTKQVLRVGWGGGILAADGSEIDQEIGRQYSVSLRMDDGSLKQVRPFIVADLNDNDNNHELCLKQVGDPVAVSFPAGLLIDPNGDLNEMTQIKVRNSEAF